MNNTPSKIFQIGFNKCGTRTIHRFFQANGFASVHWDSGRLALAIYKNLTNGQNPVLGYEQFSVFTDMESVTRQFAFEAYKLFPALAQSFPDALFILNTRDREDWIRSRLQHGNGHYARLWKSVIGTDDDNILIDTWRADWDRHHERVEEFFSRGSTPYLKFDIAKDSPDLLAQYFPGREFHASKYAVVGKTSPAQNARAAKPTPGARATWNVFDL
jgi:hypothetical protein